MIKRVFKIILIASAIILFLDTMQNKLAVNAALREAKVTEVLNGNTIKVWMDKEGYEETVQLIGIDPKMGRRNTCILILKKTGILYTCSQTKMTLVEKSIRS